MPGYKDALARLEAAEQQAKEMESGDSSFASSAVRMLTIWYEDTAEWLACSGETNMMKWARRLYTLSMVALVVGSSLAYPGLLLQVAKDTSRVGSGAVLLTVGSLLLLFSCCVVFCCTCHLDPLAVSKQRRFEGTYL